MTEGFDAFYKTFLQQWNVTTVNRQLGVTTNINIVAESVYDIIHSFLVKQI